MSATGIEVRTGSRLHVGFRSLSQIGDRLFGGVGLAIEEPGLVVQARPASTVRCEHPRARQIARRAVDLLGVAGATVTVKEALPTHQGYGSGTQLTLAVALAIARSHAMECPVRECATALGRGKRSGVGVACFERGGFVVDEGHQPTRPDERDQVPQVAVREPIPENWRFVLVRPDASPGRCDDDEDRSIDRAIASADAALGERIEAALRRRVLPGVREGEIDAFGTGITRIDALTGTWFADEQGAAHRPPCDRVIEGMASSDSIAGWGQSSWGPLCYGVTKRASAPDAVADCETALGAAGLEGSVTVAAPRNRGATVRRIHESRIDPQPS